MEIHLVADGVDFVHDGLLSAGSNWSVGVWSDGTRNRGNIRRPVRIPNTPTLQYSITPGFISSLPLSRSPATRRDRRNPWAETVLPLALFPPESRASPGYPRGSGRSRSETTDVRQYSR